MNADREEQLFIRLLLDEDVHPQAAPALRRRGFDVVSMHEIGRAGRRISDDDQLAFAVEQGRAIFSYNEEDFVKLYLAWLSAGKRHFGIVVYRQISLPELIRRLARFLNTVTADEIANNLRWLPH
ncbi:MAG: DUF5615 family PIN-like protein [Anaerolineae bacterium]